MPKRILFAGLSHEIHTFLDGTSGPREFTQLTGETTQVLSTADFRASSGRMVEDTIVETYCVVISCGGACAVLLSTQSTPPFDLAQWRRQGFDPGSIDFIVVKAAVAHRRAYDPIAARMLWVVAPGPCTRHLNSLPFRGVTRPIYPLDS
jgi:microcystin degradation protein MlrC